MIADLVRQIVRPTAVGVDVVEILVQALGQQETHDVEILVVMRRQPARVGASLLRRVRACEAPPENGRNRPGRAAYADARSRRHLRNDRRFQVAVMAHQVAHHFQQVGERFFAIDEERRR